MTPLETSHRLYPASERELTVDDWYALDVDFPRCELHEGMLVMVPPPDGSHQSVATVITVALGMYGFEHGGRALAAPSGVRLADDIAFEPDVLYLSSERIGLLQERGVEAAPDLVVEVASPSTRRYDLRTKLPAYLAHGVREVWIVDPRARTVAVYHEAAQSTATVAFGEPIPSTVVPEIGTAHLERAPRLGR